MDDFLDEFKSETKKLVADMIEILETIETDFNSRERLKDYGLFVDRILGGASSLGLESEHKEYLDNMAHYAEICKLVAYRGAEIERSQDFYIIVTAILLDATEMLQEFVLALNTDQQKDIKDLLSKTFLERLKIVNQQFSDHTRGSVVVQDDQVPRKTSQEEIDALIDALL